MRAMVRYKNLAVAKLRRKGFRICESCGRKWTDELICIFVAWLLRVILHYSEVLVLSFAASLVPGTDIHSLALLLGTGPESCRWEMGRNSLSKCIVVGVRKVLLVEIGALFALIQMLGAAARTSLAPL